LPNNLVFQCSDASYFKPIEKDLDIKDGVVEENEELITSFNLFEED
jgi:hypothetical protein